MQYTGTRFDSFMSGLEQGLRLDQFKHILLIFNTAKKPKQKHQGKNTVQMLNHTNAEAPEGLADYSNSPCHLQSQLLFKNYSLRKGK